MPPRRACDNSGNNNDVPPGMQQMLEAQMQAQTHFFQMMTQMMNNNSNNNNNNNHHNPPQQDHLTRFLRLNPPSFSSSSEPIVADDWLRTINNKLDTIEAQEVERVWFAAHQLEGPAAEWWDNYQITYPDVNTITWNQFQQAFRTAHVVDRVIQLKRREFRDLHQGSRSVIEYGEIFNKLARYAPDDVSTDAKRQSEFIRGLNDEISIQLVAVRFNSYQELLDRAVVVEDKHNSMENRKRKINH
jgi:hypothetical protein